MVGAVLVYAGRIIGEGYHMQYGGPHAEVNCIQSVKPEDEPLIAQSTIYVSLEPCSHHGKTPPCSDLIIERGIKRVVTGSHDPNPLVSGKGIARMRAAGIEVTEGLLAADCDELNRRFMTYHTAKRPYVILKWAQTIDGFIAPEGDEQVWLTNDYSKKLVHKWRTEEQAILVGTRTALIDDPALTARLWQGRNPLRLLIDLDLRVPTTNQLFNTDADTVVYNLHREEVSGNIHYRKITQRSSLLPEIMADLYQRHILSLIVEGGAQTLQGFIDAGLYDEARIFTAPVRLDAGIKAPTINASLLNEDRLIDDLLQIWRRR
jgi:diaminohydroxyphosphoribosylaminopyrimidine deaminase/5-amino-6-(5-phosphoribosylamino)uracil reductase